MNQCDGCNRKLPIRDGKHYDPKTGYVVQYCIRAMTAQALPHQDAAL